MSESRFAGVDWASEEHAVCVGGERGRIVEGRGYRDNEEGIRALCARLARPRVVLVALERPDGLLIERLLDAGLVVIAVYPNLQVEGFLVERSECADALGRSAGVPVGRRVAGRGQRAPGGSGGAGWVVGRSGVAVAAGGALALGVRADRPRGVDGGPADDRVGDVRAADGAQTALPVGVSHVGGGGVGLDSPAAVLPDLVDRAGARRVDGAQAGASDRRGDGGGVDARDDREGVPGEAVSAAGGADRFDGDRRSGRCRAQALGNDDCPCERARPARSCQRPRSCRRRRCSATGSP